VTVDPCFIYALFADTLDVNGLLKEFYASAHMEGNAKWRAKLLTLSHLPARILPGTPFGIVELDVLFIPKCLILLY